MITDLLSVLAVTPEAAACRQSLCREARSGERGQLCFHSWAWCQWPAESVESCIDQLIVLTTYWRRRWTIWSGNIRQTSFKNTSCATFFISCTYAAMALSLLISPRLLQASLTHQEEKSIRKKLWQKNNRPYYEAAIDVNKTLITPVADRPFIATHGVPEARPRHRTRSTHGLLVQAIKTQHHLIGGPVGTCKTTQNIQSEISTMLIDY